MVSSNARRSRALLVPEAASAAGRGGQVRDDGHEAEPQRSDHQPQGCPH